MNCIHKWKPKSFSYLEQKTTVDQCYTYALQIKVCTLWQVDLTQK